MGRRMLMRWSPAKIDHQARGEQAEEGGRRTRRGRGVSLLHFPGLVACPAPTILQREAKQAPPSPLQQATPTGAISAATGLRDAKLTPPGVAAMGDEADVEVETLAREEHRAPPAPTDL